MATSMLVTRTSGPRGLQAHLLFRFISPNCLPDFRVTEFHGRAGTQRPAILTRYRHFAPRALDTWRDDTAFSQQMLTRTVSPKGACSLAFPWRLLNCTCTQRTPLDAPCVSSWRPWAAESGTHPALAPSGHTPCPHHLSAHPSSLTSPLSLPGQAGFASWPMLQQGPY